MHWLSPGDNAWQMTAATFVGLMSVPGLVVLYGGVMQKRWSVNSMMMAFIAFALVLIVWVLWGFNMAFGHPMHILGASSGIFANGVSPSGIRTTSANLRQPVCRMKAAQIASTVSPIAAIQPARNRYCTGPLPKR